MIPHGRAGAYEEKQVSKEAERCLLECLTCVELWGRVYDGNACARGCLITDGGSIDNDCQNGINISKRYAVMKARDECHIQCFLCLSKMTKRHYDYSRCINACEQSRGMQRDTKCLFHFAW